MEKQQQYRKQLQLNNSPGLNLRPGVHFQDSGNPWLIIECGFLCKEIWYSAVHRSVLTQISQQNIISPNDSEYFFLLWYEVWKQLPTPNIERICVIYYSEEK